MESRYPVPPTTPPSLRHRFVRLGWLLAAGWVLGIFGWFIFGELYQPQPISGWDVLIVVAIAVLVPLFVYLLWRLLVQILSGFRS